MYSRSTEHNTANLQNTIQQVYRAQYSRSTEHNIV